MEDKVPNESETILSVSDLNREARYLLEGSFPSILVEGEISNIATPASGHWYLTLKDDSAQVRCAMFRNRNLRVRFRPADGMQVLVKGKVSLYEGRGDFQLIIEQMEERGDGALLRAFEQLKEKLFREGLFDEEHKIPPPELPRHIGVITSPTGAAIRDIISTFGRRFPAIEITVIPVTVQGDTAAGEIMAAIKLANKKQGCLSDLDVLVIGRGGGSLEDLWCFNDEKLARSIFDSELPIVSAVGHEVDFTIADLVADVRAATPTAAAELLSPDQEEFRLLFTGYNRQLAGLMLDSVKQKRQATDWLRKRLKHPGRKLMEQAQRLDDTDLRLRRAYKHRQTQWESSVRQLLQGLLAHSPARLVKEYRHETVNLSRRIRKSIHQVLQNKKLLLASQSHALNSVSPLNTLSRGYSITYTADSQVITDYKSVVPGDTISSRVLNGEVTSTVTKTSASDNTALQAGNGPDRKAEKLT